MIVRSVNSWVTVAVTAVAFAGGLSAQTVDPQKKLNPRTAGEHLVQARMGWWKIHLADSGVHLAATSLDAASSWGRPEMNPLLRSADGRFGGQGLAVKLAVFGGAELVKWTLLRNPRRRDSRLVRSISIVPGAVLTGTAVRNWRVQ